MCYSLIIERQMTHLNSCYLKGVKSKFHGDLDTKSLYGISEKPSILLFYKHFSLLISYFRATFWWIALVVDTSKSTTKLRYDLLLNNLIWLKLDFNCPSGLIYLFLCWKHVIIAYWMEKIVIFNGILISWFSTFIRFKTCRSY